MDESVKDFQKREIREELVKGLDEFRIPERMREAIIGYVMYGRPVGHFLNAVFSHDLFEAVARADGENARLLPEYVKFIHNRCPVFCHGGGSIVPLWLSRGGLFGTLQDTTADIEEIKEKLDI